MLVARRSRLITTVATFLLLASQVASVRAEEPATAPDKDAWTLLGRADTAYDEGNIETARALYEQTLQAAPDDVVVQIRAIRSLAAIEYHAGNLKASIGQLELAKDLAEKASVDGDEWLELLNQLDSVLNDARQYGKSLAVRTQIVEAKEAELRRYRFFQGHVASNAGEIERATEIYRQCLADAEAVHDEKNAIWAFTCLMYAEMRRGNYAEALRWAEHRVQRAPDQAFSYSGRGYVRIAAGNWDIAATDLSKSLQIQPSFHASLLLWTATARQGQANVATERLRGEVVKVKIPGEACQEAVTWILSGMVGHPSLRRPKDARSIDTDYSEACYLVGRACW